MEYIPKNLFNTDLTIVSCRKMLSSGIALNFCVLRHKRTWEISARCQPPTERWEIETRLRCYSLFIARANFRNRIYTKLISYICSLTWHPPPIHHSPSSKMATGGAAVTTKHSSHQFSDQIKQLEIEGAKLMTATSNLGGMLLCIFHHKGLFTPRFNIASVVVVPLVDSVDLEIILSVKKHYHCWHNDKLSLWSWRTRRRWRWRYV